MLIGSLDILAQSTMLPAEHICPTGFFCGCPVGVEFSAEYPTDPNVGKDI